MILKAAIAIYLVGLLVFYTLAVDNIPAWRGSYYLWDKMCGGGWLLWYVIYINCKERQIVAPVLWFSVIRFIWEIVSLITGITVSNEWAIAIMFIILVALTGYVCLHPMGRIGKFLNKNVP